MNNSIDYSEFIERYLDGEMTPEEKTWFEKELENNPGLDKEIQFRRELNEAIAEDEVIQLRMAVNSLYKEGSPAEQKRGISRRVLVRRLVPAASALLVVLLVLLAGRQWIHRYSPEEIFNQYFEPYEMPVYRNGNSQADQLFREALETYQNKEFERAIVLFEEVLTADASKMDANLLSGISKIETERYREANTNFRRIIDHHDNMFIEQAEWYLALSYLMTGEGNKATALFRQISEAGGTYHAQARSILRKIR